MIFNTRSPIPIATTSVIGGVKIGTGLSIDSAGVLSSNNSVTIDSILNTASDNPVKNSAITVALNNKADKTEIPTNISELTNDAGYLTSYTETDPTVPSWAKASTKPTYTASEVGAASSSHTHGNITNAGDITTTAAIASGDRLVINDESASKITNSSITFGNATSQYLANNGTWQNVPVIPTNVSSFNNDADYLTSYTETDPTVPGWAKASSKPTYTFSEIDSKPTTISGYGISDAYTKTQIDNLVAGVLHYKGTKATVSNLPTSGNTIGDTWHITADGSEWAWDGTSWQELGTAVDLSNYVTTDDSRLTDARTPTAHNQALSTITNADDLKAIEALTGTKGLLKKTAANTWTLDTSNYLTSYTETDPTVPSWAKASSKPTYTADEVGAISTTAAAASITTTDISNWNNKVSDDKTWNGVTLNKSIYSQRSDKYIPFIFGSNTSGTTAYYTKSTATPAASCIAQYDENDYLYSTTPSATDNSTKVATTSYVKTVIPDVSNFITSSDIPTDVSSFNNDAGYLTSYTETDPTVPSWAKQTTKPSYTASEVGAASSSHTHGNITNTGDITATAPTIANGDQIIINDNSASKITNGPTFDGSTTTKALTPKGTWETFSQFSGSYNDLTNTPSFIVSDIQYNAIQKSIRKTRNGVASDVITIDTLKTELGMPTKVSDLTNDTGYITDAGVTSFNGSTGAITYTAPVTSVNGQTGAITGLATTSQIPAASTTSPSMDGTASYGSGTAYARANHVHPTDTSRQATLVSGTNIKTINNNSILGSGNLTITPTTVSVTQTVTTGVDIGEITVNETTTSLKAPEEILISSTEPLEENDYIKLWIEI